MAIAIRAVGSWAAATATTQTVTLPTHAAGDMLIVRVVAKGPTTLTNNLVICNTSGWTAVGAMVFGGSTASSNGGGSVWARAFYKVATSAAETNPVLTFQNPSGTNVAMLPSAAVALSYQKGSTEIWATPVGAGAAVAAATAISASVAGISSASGDMIDAFVGTNDNTTLTVPTFTQSGMTFATVTEAPATALSSATSNDISADGSYRLATAGTSSSNIVITGTNSVADEGVGYATRLRLTLTQSLTIPLLDASPALYAPTLSGPPPQSLTIPLLDASRALYAPTLTAISTLTLPLLGGGTPNYRSEVLADSPIHYYRMGEPSGSSVNDEVGTADFTLTNTPTMGVAGAITGDSDTAVAFASASTEYASASFSMTAGAFSYECWAKRTTNAISQFLNFFGGSPYNDTAVQWEAAGTLTVRSNDYTNVVTSSIGITDANWHHIAVVYDGSGNWKVYVDGVDRTTVVTTSTAAPDGALTFRIGAGDGGYQPFDGALDEVAVYQSALTAAQIRDHYVAGVGAYAAAVRADSPTAYWRLGEASGTSAYSEMGGLTGTYTGTPTLGQTGIPGGNGGKAVKFPSSSDYVQLTDDPLLEPGTAYTWEAWVKRTTISDNTCFYSKETGGQFYGMANGNLRIGNNGGTVATSTSTRLADTNWHHVAITYAGTGAGNTKIYVDGVEGHTDGSQIGVGFVANSVNPRIGDASYGGEPSLATIAETAIYQSVLTPARIWAHYVAGLGAYANAILADAPVFVAPMGESSGSLGDLVDGKLGTVAGTPTYGVTGPFPGHTGVDYGAGTDYHSFADDPDFDLGNGGFSVEYWHMYDEDLGVVQVLLYKGAGAMNFTVADNNAHMIGKAGTASMVAGLTNSVSVDGKWHHIVWTRVASPAVAGDTKLYVDGVRQALGLESFANTTSDTADPFIIGRENTTERSGSKLAWVAIYKSVLTPSQISAHYVAAAAQPSQAMLFGPTIEGVSGGTTQSLTIPLLESTPALYAPTLLPGPITATLPLLESTPALYAPTLVPKNTLTLGLLDSGSALYAPTLTRYNTLTIPLLDAGPALYQPTLTPKNTVDLGLLESTPALYAPDLTLAPYPITLPLLDAGPALYAPTVVRVGGVTQDISLGLLESTPALYEPTLAVQPVTISLGLLDAGPALYQPTLTPKNLLTIPLLDAGAALYAPALGFGITVPLLDSGSALYEPTLVQVGGTFQTITLGLLDSGPALYTPTIVPGAVGIILPLLDGSSALYAPALYQTQAITLGLLDAGPAVYAPTLYAYNPIVLPLLDGEGALYAPVLTNTAVFITGITRDSNGTPLGTVEVHVFRTSDDVEVAQVTSNALGVFSIQVQAGIAHYIVAYKTGTPDRAGTTLNTLVGS